MRRQNMLRCCEVLERDADGFEERDLVVVPAADVAARNEISQLSLDMRPIDNAARHRIKNISRFPEGAFEGVDENARTCHGVIVCLPHMRRETTDQVDEDARLEPAALQHWLGAA